MQDEKPQNKDAVSLENLDQTMEETDMVLAWKKSQ